jgi:phage-related protein
MRVISWLKGAKRDFEAFPEEVQIDAQTALTIAAHGGKADTAKPFKGVDGGVFEIVLKHRGNAYRVLYAVQIDTELWVVDAFQKKSKTGISTPKVDVDRIKERIKQLRKKLR